ncbi:hypothetical protein F5Y12DRAFT_744092 [Xylaria sp. FL1777]|nr:hypothetical protein F5Y12DRAFT_744092 [Xylaria sp. FL1777]
MDFVLLAAFGEETFFRSAFNYTLPQIVSWLKACSRGEKGGERTKDPAVAALLSKIGPQLSDLILPDGKEFKNPNLSPNSHFLRNPDPLWVKNVDVKKQAKFILRPVPFTYQGALGKAVPVDWWNPYDLLGLFLSILGPAPAAATKNNYFLPLCAVYARWCSCIAGHPAEKWKWSTQGDGAGDWPYMFNVTWRPEGKPVDRVIYFFLGGSTAGDDWEEKVVGQWRTRVQRQRFNVLYAHLQMQLFAQDTFDKASSPKQLRSGAKTQCYGNCAETYPFIFSVRSKKEDNKNLFGLALMREFMSVESLNTYDPSVGGQVWGNLSGPCDNCATLITGAGADTRKFGWRWDQRDAPSTATMDKPATTPAPTAAADAPEGWSNKPEDLNNDYYWGTNGDGALAAKLVGLTNPQGLLIADRDRGSDQYIFKDGTTGKIYLWSMMTNEISEYTKPTDLDGIIAQLKLPIGKASLESMQLHDV